MTPHAADTALWIEWIKKVCDPKVYLDIGAGDGFDCGVVKEAFPDCRCLALEPWEPWEPWDVHGGVERHRQVIAGHDDYRCFYVKDTPGIHGMYSRNARPTLRVEAMAARTLAHFCDRENITQVDAMKIDVEGAAWDVLSGASLLLCSVKAVHIETEWIQLFDGQHLEHEVFPLLESAGLTKVWEHRVEELGQGDSIWVRQ